MNFEYYKALKKPVSRRLFEVLCKSFENSNVWSIKLVNLGKKLTLTPRQERDREVYYASAVLIAVKPAIKEINKISSDKKLLKKAGVKLDQAFILNYEIYGIKQDRVIKFTKSQIENEIEIPNEEIEQLLKLVKKTGKRVLEAIRKHYSLNGYEYVKRNIEYSNEKANKQYSAHLCKSLDQDWADEWSEEKKEKIELENKQREENKRIEKEQQLLALENEQVKKEKPLYLQEVKKLDNAVKISLWEQAVKKVDENLFNKEGMIKVEYNELLWQYFNKQGISFCKGIGKDFRLGLSLDKPF